MTCVLPSQTKDSQMLDSEKTPLFSKMNSTPFARFSIGFNNQKYSNYIFEIKVVDDLTFQQQGNKTKSIRIFF
jgi:hypothetical protein